MKLLDDRDFKKVIGVGKIGRSIKFSKDFDQRSNSKGDYEVVNFLRLMSDREPETQFIYLTQSNLHKIDRAEFYELFPNKNVDYLRYHKETDIINKIWKDPMVSKIQKAYIFSGPHTSYNGIDPNHGALCMFSNYAGPIINYLNKTHIPWEHIITDNRYMLKSLELTNLPIKTWTQSNIGFTHYLGEHRIATTPVDFGSIWMYKRKELKRAKRIKAIAVANQISKNGDKRFKLIKKYIIDNNLDTLIIGKWTENEYLNEMGNNIVNKDGLNSIQLESIMLESKFGLIFNYDKITKNDDFVWIVSKMSEYIHSDVIPLFINYNGHRISGIPKECFIESPAHLKDVLNSYEEKTQELLKYVKEYYEYKKSGDYIYDKFSS